jgi:hypothetical protein
MDVYSIPNRDGVKVVKHKFLLLGVLLLATQVGFVLNVKERGCGGEVLFCYE